jgi:hypothetical protein
MKLTAQTLTDLAEDGCTIVISNHLRAWEVDAKTVRRWRKVGREIFKQGKDGHILMGRGKHYDDISYCAIKVYR